MDYVFHLALRPPLAVCGHCRRLVIDMQGGGLLVYGGITTSGGDRLNRTFGRPKVRPDFRPFSRPKQGGVDGLNCTFGRPKVRRADKYTEPIGTPNPRCGLIR